MTRHSVQPRDWIFGKGYGFLSFAKNMGENIVKNISKILSGKYSHKLLNHAKKFATDALKTTSKKVIKKTLEATGDLIGNKTADRITKVSKSSLLNNSETVANENDKEIAKEWYVSPEESQKLMMI